MYKEIENIRTRLIDPNFKRGRTTPLGSMNTSQSQSSDSES